MATDRLKRAAMDPTAENSPSRKTAPVLPHGTRVLLAEDTFASRRLLSILLEKAGAEVTAVDQGQAAVERSLEAIGQRRPFDVVVLDMAMPILNGYEAAQRLRADGYLGPIIALTAHVFPGEREKCLAAGCDDYVGKPVDRTLLVTTLARHVAQGRAAGKPLASDPVPPPEPPQPKPAKSLLESLPEPERSRLLKDFVDGLVERVEKMEIALGDRDPESLTHLAHSIHGTAYLFSFPEIAQCAGQIERELRAETALELLGPGVARLGQLCRAAAAKV